MKKLFILPILLLLAGLQLAQAQKSWDEIEYPPLNSFEKPDVEIFELDNGITFYLVEDDELPLINLRVLVRTGGVLVPNEKTGLQSVAGTVMRTGGTTSITGDDLNELLEDRAARMETGIGLTSGSATMNVLKDDFEGLLPTFIDLLQNPAFPENRINLAKTQQKSGISRRNDETLPIGIREFQKLLYGPESVYARNTEYETIDNITRDDLIEFHRKSFVGQNMMVGVIGDFNAAEMKRTLRQAFQSIPAGEKINFEFPEINYEYTNTINFVDKRDVNQSFVMLGHIGGLRDNPDYAKIQVMNRVLSDGFSGRLMRIVRSQMGLAYAVFGQYGSGNFYPGMFYSGVMTQSTTTAEAINAILEQIRRLQDEPVSQEELESTKDRYLNSLVFEYDSRASVLNERMSLDYAGLDPDTFDRLVEDIQKVTVEDIQQVARDYLRPDALQILVVGNGEEIGDQLEQYGDVNLVDITIPVPGSDEEVADGDAAGGAEWLNRLAQAVLVEGDYEGVLKREGNAEVSTPMGAMSMGRNEELNFSEDTYVIELKNTPQGDITFNLSGNQGTISAGAQQMQLPPAQVEMQKNEYKTFYVYVLLNRSDFTPEFMGGEEVDGRETVHLRLRGDKNLNYYLDPETALPVKLSYSEFDPQAGEQVLVEAYYDDWQVKDGVAVAYSSVTKVGGEQQAKVTITNHSIE